MICWKRGWIWGIKPNVGSDPRGGSLFGSGGSGDTCTGYDDGESGDNEGRGLIRID